MSTRAIGLALAIMMADDVRLEMRPDNGRVRLS